MTFSEVVFVRGRVGHLLVGTGSEAAHGEEHHCPSLVLYFCHRDPRCAVSQTKRQSLSHIRLKDSDRFLGLVTVCFIQLLK